MEPFVGIAQIVVLVLTLVFGGGEKFFVSYYGTESDGYIGQYHGSYWHGYDCGLPDVVDDVNYGAAAPRWIPYCSKLLVCSDTKCVLVTVVDRQRDDIINGFPHIDVWPAVAKELDMIDSGIAVFDVVSLYDQSE